MNDDTPLPAGLVETEAIDTLPAFLQKKGAGRRYTGFVRPGRIFAAGTPEDTQLSAELDPIVSQSVDVPAVAPISKPEPAPIEITAEEASVPLPQGAEEGEQVEGPVFDSGLAEEAPAPLPGDISPLPETKVQSLGPEAEGAYQAYVANVRQRLQEAKQGTEEYDALKKRWDAILKVKEDQASITSGDYGRGEGFKEGLTDVLGALAPGGGENAVNEFWAPMYRALSSVAGGGSFGASDIVLDMVEKGLDVKGIQQEGTKGEMYAGAGLRLAAGLASGQELAKVLQGFSYLKNIQNPFVQQLAVRTINGLIIGASHSVSGFATGRLSGKDAALNFAQSLISSAISVVPEAYVTNKFMNGLAQIALDFTADIAFDASFRSNLQDKGFSRWFFEDELMNLIPSMVGALGDWTDRNFRQKQRGLHTGADKALEDVKSLLAGSAQRIRAVRESGKVPTPGTTPKIEAEAPEATGPAKSLEDARKLVQEVEADAAEEPEPAKAAEAVKVEEPPKRTPAQRMAELVSRGLTEEQAAQEIVREKAEYDTQGKPWPPDKGTLTRDEIVTAEAKAKEEAEAARVEGLRKKFEPLVAKSEKEIEGFQKKISAEEAKNKPDAARLASLKEDLRKAQQRLYWRRWNASGRPARTEKAKTVVDNASENLMRDLVQEAGGIRAYKTGPDGKPAWSEEYEAVPPIHRAAPGKGETLDVIYDMAVERGLLSKTDGPEDVISMLRGERPSVSSEDAWFQNKYEEDQDWVNNRSETRPLAELVPGASFKLKGETFKIVAETEDGIIAQDGKPLEISWSHADDKAGDGYFRMDKGSFVSAEEAAPKVESPARESLSLSNGIKVEHLEDGRIKLTRDGESKVIGSDDPKHAALSKLTRTNTPAETKRVRAVLEDAAKQLQGANIKVVDTVDELPEGYRESNVEGLYLAKDGTSYVVAGNIKPGDEARVITHEAVIHGGLRTLMSEEQIETMLKNSYLNEVQHNIAVAKLMKERRIGKTEALEELMADIWSRRSANPSLFVRLVAQMRDMLRKIIPSLKWTENDVENLIARAAENVRGRGKGVGDPNGREGALFSKNESVVAGPKYLRHEGVQEVSDFLKDSGGSYKWDVFLKEGWVWSNGRNAGGRTMHINNKADFDYAAPVRKEDYEYLSLAKDPEKNKAELQRMVDEKAREAGYNIGPVWHGTSNQFTVFKEGVSYFTSNERDAWRYGQNVKRFFLRIDHPAAGQLGYDFAKQIRTSAIQQKIASGKIDGFRTSDGSYITTHPSQIKLADPVTYDDKGNVIPLSQRFQSGQEDMRFSKSSDEEASRIAEDAMEDEGPIGVGIKNRAMRDMLAGEGLDDVPRATRREWQVEVDQAQREMNEDPGLQSRLISDLLTGKRTTIDAWEHAVLDARAVELNNRLQAASDDFNKIVDEGGNSRNAAARVSALNDDLYDLALAAKKAGTATARSLAFRRAMFNEDFTLVSLSARKRAANSGRKLSEAETTRIKKEYEEPNKKLVKELKEAQAEKKQVLSEERTRDIETLISDLLKGQTIRVRKNVAEFIDADAQIAIEEARKFGFFGDTAAARKSAKGEIEFPEQMIEIAARVGASFIKNKSFDVEKWRIQMRVALGPKIESKLPEILEASLRKVKEANDKNLKADVKKTSKAKKAPATEEEKRLKQEYRLDEKIADIENKIKQVREGTYEPPVKRKTVRPVDRVIQSKQDQLKALRAKFDAELARDRRNGQDWVDSMNVFLKERKVKLPEATVKGFEDRLRAASKIADDGARNKAIIDVINEVVQHTPVKAGEWFEQYVYSNMLSGPKTHERNIFGNLLNALVTRPVSLAVARDPAGAARYFKSAVGAILTGNARRSAIDALWSGEQGKFTETLKQLSDDASEVEKKAALFAMQKRIVGPKNKLARKLWKLNTFTGRLLYAEDAYFSAIIEAGEKARLMASGQTAEQADAAARRVADEYLYRDRVRPQSDRSLDGVSQLLERTGAALDSIRQTPGPLGKVIKLAVVPFLRTPVKIAQFNAALTPLSYIGANRDRIARAYYGSDTTYEGMVSKLEAEAAKDQPDMELVNKLESDIANIDKVSAERFAKANIGMFLMALGFTAAVSGNTTWSAPQDPQAKKLFYDAGYKPYSFRLPGTNKWIPMMFLGPAALAFMIPASAHETWLSNPDTVTDDFVNKLFKTVASVPVMMMDQLPLQGLSSIYNVVQGREDWNLNKIVGRVVAQGIPGSGLLRWLRELVDPEFKKTLTLEDTIKADIPGLSSSVEALKTSDNLDAKMTLLDALAPYRIGVGNEKKEIQYQQRLARLRANARYRKSIKDYQDKAKKLQR